MYPCDEFDQPLTDKIEGLAQKCCKSGWVNLEGGGFLPSSIKLIEKSVYDEFKIT